MRTVYDASAPVELSTTAGDDELSALFSVAATAAVAIGNVTDAAVNIKHCTMQSTDRTDAHIAPKVILF